MAKVDESIITSDQLKSVVRRWKILFLVCFVIALGEIFALIGLSTKVDWRNPTRTGGYIFSFYVVLLSFLQTMAPFAIVSGIVSFRVLKSVNTNDFSLEKDSPCCSCISSKADTVTAAGVFLSCLGMVTAIAGIMIHIMVISNYCGDSISSNFGAMFGAAIGLAFSAVPLAAAPMACIAPMMEDAEDEIEDEKISSSFERLWSEGRKQAGEIGFFVI